MTERENFISWLNDAYSTELAMIPVLENHAKDARDYPEIERRDLQHLEETRRQAERVKTLIENLGGKVSTGKKLTGKTLGLGHSVFTGMFPDELVKNFLQDYAAEHLEIASYKSLIAAAEHLGEHECVPVLKEILAEEEAMAAWIKDHIPMATVESLKIASSDGDGGRQSNGEKSLARRVLKPSSLVTVLGIGAIGAGAAMLLRSKSDKTVDDGAETSVRNLQESNSIGSSSIGGDGGIGDIGSMESSSMSGSGDLTVGNKILDTRDDDFGTTEVIVRETLIIEEEPDLIASRRASGAGDIL